VRERAELTELKLKARPRTRAGRSDPADDLRAAE
jgi:hypothetical protein